jgi:uncharacterized protein YbjT (DUF2867 family)
MSDKNELKKVLVFGATGAQGSPVARQLIEKGIAVRAVSRDMEKVRAFYGDAVEAANADLSDLDSLRKAFEGVDAAFLHLPFRRKRCQGDSKSTRQCAAGGKRS